MYSRKLRALDAANEHYLQDRDLTKDTRALLIRAQRAQSTIIASQVHRLDLIDRQRNEVVLPVQVWEIASALREYSRLSGSTAADSSSAEVVALQAVRRQALRVSQDGVEQRIVALEEYAAQVWPIFGIGSFSRSSAWSKATMTRSTSWPVPRPTRWPSRRSRP
ncbi:hypothetical protein ABT143_08875 [Streptomyces sp. NPDC002033]